jgi:nucleotide-binding universal stress UspA family protein
MTECPPRRILVAVDFGAASAQAVTHAGSLAQAFGATLTAVHAEALDLPPYFTPEQISLLEAGMKAAREEASAALSRFVGAHTSSAATVRISDAPAVEAILEAAAGADLVVMGTHGRRGPRAWWLGSVAERVVREAGAPVLVVHARPELQNGKPMPRGNVLLTSIAGEHPAARIWADAIARVHGITVRDGPPVDRCAPDAATGVALIVVPMPAPPAERTLHSRLSTLMRSCPTPLLFVPDAPARAARANQSFPIDGAQRAG